MILVDSSVWIDKLAHRRTLQTEALEALILAEQNIGVGDLMLVEVLQGTRSDRANRDAQAYLAEFDLVQISDHRVAVEAARHYRHLRNLGITIRKTIDTLIATRCILDRLPLLYSDRDFDPFVQHLGLRSALVTPE
ncbi:PIN domain nuclease [Sphingomonas sp. RP10(2022)]|uniref:Ribonuclease VapC n=1 Tax=Sphingomonas liriopis TaxID=2949094 RepID=A0A9X2HV88_9SPHN|nr:PIN domain nuclease [Sphingomonas liriopis]MCP3736567.1 PIN domain nuclease [Sphingomonas liriopis]